MAEADALRALVRQHAETSKLLGVPFVPSYRAGADGDGASAQRSEPRAAGPRERPAERPAERPMVRAPVEVEIPDERRVPDSPVPHESPEQAASAESSVAEVAPVMPEGTGTKADRLAALRDRYIADEPHREFETAHTSIVFGEGDPDARLMFVGEAPGADEDRLGRPFVGKSGQLLDKMIVAMGLSREAVYIANVLKTRPPGNRTPTIEEARVCAPYLYEQIRIVSPEVIVTLGKSAGQLLLGNSMAMGAMRGQWAEFPPATPLVPVDKGFAAIPVMPTYHPAYLLRSYTAENRAAVWSDLKLVIDRLGLGG